MVKYRMYEKLKNYKQKGWPKTKIARKLGLNYRTVDKYYYMSETEFAEYQICHQFRNKMLDPYLDEIICIYEANDFRKLSKAAVYDCLEEKFGEFPINPRTFRRYINFLVTSGKLEYKKSPQQRNYRPVDELPFGKQLQVDFGYHTCRSGLKLHIFAAILSASRSRYCACQSTAFTTDDFIKHLLDCFEVFGGIPEEIVIDQDRLIVVDENLGDIIFTRKFRDFVDEMGLKIYLCRKADPESKGKVEALVKYVKGNFLSARDFETIEEADGRMKNWCWRVNNKISPVTRRIPRELIEQEHLNLRPLKASIFQLNNSQLSGREKRKVDKLGDILVKSCRYQLPDKYRGEYVEIFLTEKEVYSFDIRTGELIVLYERLQQPGGRVSLQRINQDRETKIAQLKEDILSWHSEESWRIFVNRNLEKYPRYIRDNYHYAKRNFRADLNKSTFLQAIEFCLENRFYGMKKLYEAYQYYNRDLIYEPKLKARPIKSINVTIPKLDISHHNLELYKEMVREA